MSVAATVGELLERGADDAPAIGAPGRAPLTYAGLRDCAAAVGGRLRGLGIGRDDVVAMVLPNGPEMASAFVAIAANATAAPLNPACRADELRFYLSDLGARLVVVATESGSVAAAVAAELGIPVATLLSDPEAAAGSFDLAGTTRAAARARRASGDDVALILHTSGTTSRPKLVPLRQRNICASAANVAASLALTPADRCLNIMPLFHIHGLIAAVLASLHAGASVHCTPGFNALQFYRWLDEIGPTWYTGVPTMHQAILARAARNHDVVARAKLRLIRSSSAALAPRIMAELEATFGAPVIEAYGMTEAAHQMASNPLPPRARKAGSVGVAAGPEVAVMDDAGRLLPAGASGEIVIRGANVTSGYRGNPEANAAAFVDGWLRTGDQGVIDADGYLHLTGRLKEVINRGGEKISPREIDEVLLDHPAIAQVATFARPHAKLGEDVAVAVVLKEGATADASAIRAFAAERLAAMKVPATIVFVAEIPKGATGKFQRVGLAAQLGLGSD